METLQPGLDAQHIIELQGIEAQVLAEQQAANIAQANAAARVSTVYGATSEGYAPVRVEISMGEARAASERVLGRHVGAAVLPENNYVDPSKRDEIAAKVDVHKSFMNRQTSELETEAERLRADAASKKKRDLDLAA